MRNVETPEIFPKDPHKTYGLMELVKGSSFLADRGPEDTLMAWPYLLVLEMVAGLGTTAAMLLISVLANAPLREMANPDLTENPAKAPWFFLNLQELLLHMDPALGGVIIPGMVLLVLMALPYLDRDRSDVGIWFASRKGRSIALFSAVYAILALVGLILFDEFIGMRRLMPTPELIPGWLAPLTIMGVLIGVLWLGLRLWRATRRETTIGLFTAFIVAYLLLTIVGTFFRGLGMHLAWPWELPPGSLPL